MRQKHQSQNWDLYLSSTDRKGSPKINDMPGRWRRLNMINLESILNVIANVYSDEHVLQINTNGICGIESMSGEVEIDFNGLGELAEWAERNEVT